MAKTRWGLTEEEWKREERIFHLVVKGIGLVVLGLVCAAIVIGGYAH